MSPDKATSADGSAPEPLSIDRHLAAALAAQARDSDRELLRRSVLLLGLARQEGASCVTLAQHQGTALADGPPFPPVAEWRAGLLATGLCMAVDEPTALPAPGAPLAPLVLDGLDRLYLLRWFRAERRIAAAIRTRIAAPVELPPVDHFAPRFGELFPTAGDAPDWQAVAALAALRSRFCAVTGGPGTGKTTTIARLLALMLHLQPDLRCALCAPTGKAAARLAESLQRQLPGLLPPDLAQRIAPARTLHRLLGYLPASEAFRFGPDRLLPFDVVVLDEASMVDLTLCDALLAALAPEARLLLLGDRDQLASIAPGQVLGDLCRAAQPEAGAGRGLAALYREVTGIDLEARDHPLADHVVLLRRNYRFAGQPGLAAFAAAVTRRDAAAALAALQGENEDLRWLEQADPDAVLAPASAHLKTLADADSPLAAMEALGRFRVLCATRSGPLGVEAINHRLEQVVRRTGRRPGDAWYQGRPVMVTQNDPFTRLYNGDVGVCWPDESGQSAVWFPADSGLRRLSTVRMPACETAFAMTVHKAQGSEFDEVLLLMPDRDGPLCQAPLLYTAVTRARRRATVCGSAAILQAALQRFPQRDSGLASAVQPQQRQGR